MKGNELDKLFKDKPIATIIIDPSRKIRHSNVKADSLFGYQEDELIGQPIDALIAKDLHQKQLSVSPESDNNILSAAKLIHAMKKNGTEFSAKIKFNPIDIDGSTHIIALFSDTSSNQNISHLFKSKNGAFESRINQFIKNIITYGAEDSLEKHSEINNENLLADQINSLKKENFRLKRKLDNQAIQQLQLENKVNQVSKLETIGIMASGVTHDFNNLLTVILGNIELINATLSTNNKDAQTVMDDSLDACLRARDLCAHMLNIVNDKEISFEALDLNELLISCSRLLRKNVANNINIHFELDKEIPTIKGNPAQLFQLMVNIIINAAESMSNNGGSLTLKTCFYDFSSIPGKVVINSLNEINQKPSTNRVKKFTCLEISDEGTGIPEEDLDMIFHPLFSSKTTGKGLGLSAIPDIIHNHQAALLIDSEVGIGTTMRVIFPND